MLGKDECQGGGVRGRGDPEAKDGAADRSGGEATSTENGVTKRHAKVVQKSSERHRDSALTKVAEMQS